jgi:sucrose-6-phosphate hydrolase SacC (GH32 family)
MGPWFLVTGAWVGLVQYKQPGRPQYHFTASHNFMNDPNGMVFCKCEYHLFIISTPKASSEDNIEMLLVQRFPGC